MGVRAAAGGSAVYVAGAARSVRLRQDAHMGWLPFNTPVEAAAGIAARVVIRTAEHLLDRVETVGAPLDAAGREQAGRAGHVMLVAGIGGSTIGLQPYLRSLARDGFAATGVESPDGGLASAVEGAKALDDAIAARPAGERLHLAGHSKGGMVIQEWWRTASPAQRARVETMTLISSSHTGLQWPIKAVVALSKPFTGPLASVATEALASNPMAQRIARMPIADAVRAASIISRKDGLVRVVEATWDGANNVVIEGPRAPNHATTLIDARAYTAFRDHVLASGQ